MTTRNHFRSNMSWCQAGVLFALGLTGVLVRRNVIFQLIVAGNHDESGRSLRSSPPAAHWGAPDGQIMSCVVRCAAEVAVGLGLVLQLERRFGHPTSMPPVT
jgi:NADH-quinone oxidoreductase subunit K